MHSRRLPDGPRWATEFPPMVEFFDEPRVRWHNVSRQIKRLIFDNIDYVTLNQTQCHGSSGFPVSDSGASLFDDVVQGMLYLGTCSRLGSSLA